MNEERGSTQASPAQSVPPQQSAGQTSAVNVGFDASKLGGAKNKNSEKYKKIKKSREEKTKSLNNGGPTQKSKRPLWFWLVLGLLGIVILGVVVWAVVMLTSSNSEKESTLPTDIVLVDENSDDNAVEEYFRQLQSISGKNDETSSNDRSIDDARRAASNAIAATDSEKQENAIRAAEMLLLYHDGKYDEIINRLPEVHPEWLSVSEQRVFYMTVGLAYEGASNMDMANKYQQLELEATLEACKTNTQLCEGGNN